MKEITANKTSSILPLLFPAIFGNLWFTLTLLMWAFSNRPVAICWEAGIMGTIAIGFITVRNFMENAE